MEGLIRVARVWEPANFLAAPAPDFFSSGSGSGSWFFPQAAPAPGIFLRAAPAQAPRDQKKTRLQLLTIGIGVLVDLTKHRRFELEH